MLINKKHFPGVALCLVMLMVPILAQGQGKGKGGGGGGASNTQPVSFTFLNNCMGTTIPCISDDGSRYVDGEDGVKAEIVAAGNPILDLRGKKSTRTMMIDWADCDLTTSDELPTNPQVRLNHIRIVDETFGELIEDAFRGMTDGQVGFSRIGISFANLGNDKKAGSWAIRFNEVFGGDRVRVKRTGIGVDSSWLVESSWDEMCLDGLCQVQAVAAIGRIRNGAFREVGLCHFDLTFKVDCPTCP